MKEIRLKISELFEIDRPEARERPHDLIAITAYVLKHYAFLPKPIAVTLEGDEVVISYPEEADAKRIEAERLTDRAVKRAREGEYKKAIGIYKRVLELDPAFHAARRDLAMAYMEVGDVENATNHLIEVLRLDPKDAWSWVVLGNLYIREKADLETGEKFIRKALEIIPNDHAGSWIAHEKLMLRSRPDSPADSSRRKRLAHSTIRDRRLIKTIKPE